MTFAAPDVARDSSDWLRRAARPWRRSAGLAGLLTIADVAPAVVFALGLTMALSAVSTSVGAAAPGLALAFAGLAVRGLLAQGAIWAGARTARAIKAEVRRGVVDGLFRGRRDGLAGLSAAVEGVEALDGYYSRFAPARTAAAASPLLIIAVVALASPVSALILLFTLLPFVAGMILAGTAAAGESRRQFQALERLSGLFVDRSRALPTILAFEAQGRTTREVAMASDELARRTGRVLRIAFLSSGVLEFFSALAVALVAVYCGFNLLRLLPFPVPETLDLPRAFFALALAPEVYAPIRRLAAAYHDRQAAEAAAPSLMSDVKAPADASSPGDAIRAAPSIRFWGVGVAYDGVTAVRGFDLDIGPGEIAVVQGVSGSGKSSLLHLLLGLAPLSEGEVEVDGIRLSEAGDFVGRIGWASQAPVVTLGTLGDNIALARRRASALEIRQAAQAVGLTGDLDRVIDERGGGLSGGERRRLGLARALLADAPILLLDEPTANLDVASEEAMLEVIRRAARGRTTIIATHSDKAAALADRLVRL